MSGARAWALSLALHAILLTAALVIARLEPNKAEMLRWRVSLIDTPMPTPSPPPTSPTPTAYAAKPKATSRPVPRPLPQAAPPRASENAAAPPHASSSSDPAPASPHTEARAGETASSIAPISAPADAVVASPSVSEPTSALPGSASTSPPPAAHDQPAVAPEKLWYTALAERLRDLRHYPTLARRRGQEGVVALEIVVEPDGSLRELNLLRGSGYPVLDRAAEELVRQAMEEVRDKQRPERMTRLSIPIAYRLQN